MGGAGLGLVEVRGPRGAYVGYPCCAFRQNNHSVRIPSYVIIFDDNPVKSSRSFGISQFLLKSTKLLEKTKTFNAVELVHTN